MLSLSRFSVPPQFHIASDDPKVLDFYQQLRSHPSPNAPNSQK